MTRQDLEAIFELNGPNNRVAQDCYSPSDERALNTLVGKRWTELTYEDLDRAFRGGAAALLTKEAAAYYLPALIACLLEDRKAEDVAQHFAGMITSEDVTKHIEKTFTPRQRKALWHATNIIRKFHRTVFEIWKVP